MMAYPTPAETPKEQQRRDREYKRIEKRLSAQAAARNRKAIVPVGTGEVVGGAFPSAVVVEQTGHFSIKYAVRVGGTSVAYFDEPQRADLVRQALNHFRLTPAGRAWMNDSTPNIADQRRSPE